METFTASIQAEGLDSAAIHQAAAFFGVPLPVFLDRCLAHGVEWAQGMADSAEMRLPEPLLVPRLPDPTLLAEAKALTARLREMEAKSAAGQGRTYRVSFMVPEELATVAAWLAFRADMEAQGDPRPLGRPVQLKLENGYLLADWHRARRLMWSLIRQALRQDWEMLEKGIHPNLAPETPQERAARYELDDDIPY